MIMKAGVAVRVNDAGRDHGQIRAFQNNTYDVTKAPPTVVLRNEDYGRITRILADGTPVTLEFNIVNQTYPGGRVVQRGRRDPRHRQGRRSRHARRPPRLVALGDRRDRQRDRLRGDDGSRAHPAGDRRQAAPDDPRRALGRRGAGPARIQGVRRRSTSAPPRTRSRSSHKFNGYFNVDSGTGRIRSAERLRSAGGGHHPARDLQAVRGPRHDGRQRHRAAAAPAAPTARRSTRPACRASA